MAKITWIGDKALSRHLGKLADKKVARDLIKKYGAQLQEKTVSNMHGAYIHGYSKGKTAADTTLTFSNGGMTAIVQPHTEYFPYLEFGTRKMVKMPTLAPAFMVVKDAFIAEIKSRCG